MYVRKEFVGCFWMWKFICINIVRLMKNFYLLFKINFGFRGR